MSRPTVVTTCMLGSSESWLHQQQPYSWHSRAGGGAVHSINSGRQPITTRSANSIPIQVNEFVRNCAWIMRLIGAEAVFGVTLPQNGRTIVSYLLPQTSKRSGLR